jgi:hypothetical protein
MKRLVDQASLPGMCPVTDAVTQLSQDASSHERGAIYTRREVVDFMLDLAGYTSDKDLTALRLLEPSFGSGEFLMAAIERLIESWRRQGSQHDLMSCLYAVELHQSTYLETRQSITAKLRSLGLGPSQSSQLTSAWLQQGDFLLSELPNDFDVVIGNPPYVRQELIPGPLLAEYRRRFITLYDRADLYVPFIEKSLDALSKNGHMVFICADRWTKNKYGGPLRAKVDHGFHLQAYVDMVDTLAFNKAVVAYPAITLIKRGPCAQTQVAIRPEIHSEQLRRLAHALIDTTHTHPDVKSVPNVVNGAEPWLLGSGQKLNLIRQLEDRFPTLEEAGCKVGIGVATGADKVFIAPLDLLDVEPSRKLPLGTTKDIRTGIVDWQGAGVINPFEDDGRLVDLAKYPKLAAYLWSHREVIAKRHVAQKSPENWYRTIDRITPELARTPKLLVPDIKGSAQVVYEEGLLYPHHNLYFIVSSTWDLRALQAVLLSKLAREFVQAYSTAMRGGFLRFQAQYLRRIRLPHWHNVSPILRTSLIDAATRLDLDACNVATNALFGLRQEDVDLLNT